MKNLLLVLLVALLLVGCNQIKSGDTAGKVNNTTAPTPVAAETPGPDAPSYQSVSPADAEAQKILGSYVGAFGDNKITLMITKAAGSSITGRSIVGGNDRPFEGTYTAQNGVYSAVANEPGDHKDDGVFKFSVSASDPSKVTGTWKPNDAKRPEKSYTLERRKFEYRPDVGGWPEASTRRTTPTSGCR